MLASATCGNLGRNSPRCSASYSHLCFHRFLNLEPSVDGIRLLVQKHGMDGGRVAASWKHCSRVAQALWTALLECSEHSELFGCFACCAGYAQVLELELGKKSSSLANVSSERLLHAAHTVARWHRYTGRRDTARDPEWLKVSSLLAARSVELEPRSLVAVPWLVTLLELLRCQRPGVMSTILACCGSQVCWSLAATSTRSRAAFEAAMAKVPEQSAADLGRLAWSAVELVDSPMARGALQYILEAVRRKMASHQSQVQVLEISQVVWSMAHLRVQTDVLVALKHAAVKELPKCDSRHVSNLAWSFAKLSHLDGPLLRHLASRAAETVELFGPQELSNTLWAFASATHMRADGGIWPCVERLFVSAQNMPQSLSGQQLANLLWSAARLGPSSPCSPCPSRRMFSVFLALGGAAQSRVPELSPQQLAAIVWACAAAGGASVHNKRSGGYRDPKLLSALEGGIASRITASWHILATASWNA